MAVPQDRRLTQVGEGVLQAIFRIGAYGRLHAPRPVLLGLLVLLRRPVPRLPVRPGSLRLVLALALFAVAAGLALIAGTTPAAGVVVTSRGLPINPGAADPRDFTAHNSPVVARSPDDPRLLAVVNRVDAPVFSCALHVSADGGASWSPRPIPFPAGEEKPERCYAPDAAFGPDGTLYVFFVTLKGFGNTPNAGWTVASSDGGQTFSPPRKALGPLAFQVRLAADPDVDGRLWLSWLQVERVGTFAFPEPGNPVLTARSDDGGATWTAPVQVNPAARERVLAPSVAAAGDRLSVLYLDVGDDALDYAGAHRGRGGEPYPGPWSLVLARSVDAGASWSETVVDDAVVPTQRFVVFLPPAPSLAVHGDRVHVGFTDGRLGDADVRVWTSTDGGARFGAGRRVNDTPERDGSAQYLPRLAVASDGRLDVVYYDRRADPQDTANAVSLQSSTDGGRSFGARMLLSDRSFDSRIGPGSERDLTDLGSSLGLVSTADRALAVWTDTRAGTPASGKQDLARAAVTFPAAPAWQGALPWLAALAAAAGLAVLLVRPRRRSPRSPAAGDRVAVAAAAAQAGGPDGR